MRKIYTKTGDRGMTSLYDGSRVLKADKIIEVLGTIDELNASLGLLAAFLKEPDEKIFSRQKELMSLASMVALSKSKIKPQKDFQLNEAHIENLEKEIDEMEKKLNPLEKFILPGGTKSSSLAHFSRTICRRLERLLVALHIEDKVEELILKYINRLSDWLFVYARYINFGKEIVWETK